MISVGSRDGRKRLGSRLEMEDTELEEGEAFSCHDEGQDSTINPDIDLSYIGEKLQNVLGHFQKDFEGGVSAENLGAKFGGYGSFLPTYQRSPSWSHTKSPAGAHNFGSPKSPRRQHVEDQRRNSIASSSAYPPVRSHAASRRAGSVDNSVRENHLQSKHAGESNSKGGAIMKPANSSDQRTLKVRIKVGSENLSTQKNAEIYSGLGLEVSPSSSLDCSPAISEGLRTKCLSVPEESPTSILQIMTSYPRELLLSPLPEDLIHLTAKIKIRENKHLDNASTESSGMLGNGYLFGLSHHKLEKKTPKSNGKDDTFSVDLPIPKSSRDKDYKVPLLKKENESEADILGCEELVSNALKLPLLSGTQHSTADPVKDAPTATNFSLSNSNSGVKKENCSSFMEEEHLDSKFEKLGGLPGSSAKASESKKSKSSSAAAFSQADTSLEEKSHTLEQSESNTSKGRKGPKIAGTPERSKDFPKGGSGNVEGVIRTSEKPSTGSKRKQKSGGSVQGLSTVKDELMVESSSGHGGGRKSHSNNLMPKNESHDPQKVHEKPGSRYKEFFGDMEFENEDNESISGEMTSSGGLKNDTVAKKGLSKHSTKDKCNADNLEKPVLPDVHHRFASHVDPLRENAAASEPPTGTVPVVKEDWVSCDKCHKWRLLPLGTNPNSLPNKWICRMLNWLPGMNRCSIPEEETTNALMALYNPAAPIPARASDGQHTRVNGSVGTSVGMTSVDARYPDFAQENDGVRTTAIGGKKKHGSSKALDVADLNGSTKPSNLCKKNLATPGKTSNISNRSRSPSVDTHGYQHMPQSASVAEKYNDAKREKLSFVNSADQDLNLKKRRKTDPEVSRAPKKIKSEELRFDDDDWTCENVGTSSKVGRGSSSLSNNTSDNDRYKYKNRKDLSGKTNNTVSEEHVPGASTDDLLRSGKVDKESVRKRKAKESHGSQEPFSSSGRCRPESSEFPEELLESDRRKEKKARLSKSGGKETTSGNKTSFGSDRKTKGAKDLYNGQYLSNNQAADYLKTDMGPVQPLVAANSSSSKVSGSHKSKNGQEIKGSPVESVSSSPLRFHNADRVISSRKNLDAKDDFHDVGSLAAASPKRHSGGEGGGNDGSGMVKNHVTEMYNDNMCQSNQYGSVKRYSEQHGIEEKANADQSHNSEFQAKKSGKWNSKDKLHASGSGLDKGNVKTLDSSHDSDHGHLYEKSKSRRSRSDEKSGTPIKVEKCITKKETAGGTSGESSKGPNQKKFGLDGPEAMKSQDKKQVLDSEKLPRKNGQADAGQGEKSHPLPPSAKVQNEVTKALRPVTDSQRENSVKAVAGDASDNGDALREPNQIKRSENLNGKPVRHPTPNSHKVRDVDAPSPLRRDSSSHAANSALKEAKDLKHLADRLKNSGSGESIGYYFQAALKFLHGASLLESGSGEAPKHNDLMHSMHIYSSTAKLCGFCAHEYEKLKDMAAAALAYKCMEVAYMRVVYSSHASASRDRNDLQNALQIAPSGESPSSSASDVDNLNHQATDKVALAKVVSSPQVSGSHIITSRTRSGFLRILNFAQDVNFAMEASRKSKIAFAAATSRLEETSQGESISSLKKALDFNFQDVDCLLRLVRIAMEAIAR